MTLMDLFVKQIDGREDLNDHQLAVIDHVLDRITFATELNDIKDELNGYTKTKNTD